MTPTLALAGLGALLVPVGAAVVMAGLRTAPYAPRTRHRRLSVAGISRVGVAAMAGLLAWGVTGWPVLGVAALVAVWGLPALLGADRREAARIDRVEAVEEWARRVADVLAIGVGLEQALQSAARSVPAPIEREVGTLAARIAARTPTETALRRFADEVDDPSADLVVSAMILAARRRGPGVAAALTAIAGSVGEEVAARRRVEADRAKPRATARAVTAITLIVVGVGLLNRGYTAPYGTALGQTVLMATVGFFGAALWWMHSMTVTTPPERLLASEPEDLR